MVCLFRGEFNLPFDRKRKTGEKEEGEEGKREEEKIRRDRVSLQIYSEDDTVPTFILKIIDINRYIGKYTDRQIDR